MRIDKITYKLPINNYLQVESLKKQIVFGHTFNNNMKHVIGWLHRYNGLYQKTSAFTIDINGVIHQHFNPKYQSRYFNNLDQDKKSIIILNENEGWLLKNNQNNQFINWKGDIYKQHNQVIEKKWRGYDYWVGYNEEQFNSAYNLTNLLCEEFKIPLITIGHNTKVDDLDEYRGIVYKSNLDRQYTDLSPAWDCSRFKEIIENKN